MFVYCWKSRFKFLRGVIESNGFDVSQPITERLAVDDRFVGGQEEENDESACRNG